MAIISEGKESKGKATAYCMKCKSKREITSPEAMFNKLGAPVTRGICPICGTSLYRTGRTEAHTGMTAPVIEKPEPKRTGKLVIVESPAKAKTVGRFLGKGYTVKASIGSCAGSRQHHPS